jgi:hypothetical protein
MTSPLRAVCDVARVASSATAIAMLDRALAPLNSTNRDSEPLAKVFGMSPVTRTDRAPLEREELQDALGRLGAARGIRRALFAVNFADGASGSPGESLSRLQIHRLHMPKPELQVRVPRGSGRYWDVDFGWEEEALFGEFDGFGKYHRTQMTKGKPPEQVVWEEKKRGPIDRPESYRSRRGAAGDTPKRDTPGLQRGPRCVRLFQFNIPPCALQRVWITARQCIGLQFNLGRG